MPAPPTREARLPRTLVRARVLVVDDDRGDADGLAELLTMLGAEVRVCHDGPTAVRVAPRFRPEVGFLDVNMPGMDGCELARVIKAAADGERPLLVAVTGMHAAAAEARLVGSGFDLRIPKPAGVSILSQVLAGFEAELVGPGVVAAVA